MSDPVAADFFRRARERLLRFVNEKDRGFLFWLPFGVQPFEKLAQCRNHRDGPVAGRRLLAWNRDHAFLEIHVAPPQERGLANACAAVNQTLDQIPAIATLSRAGGANGRHQLRELSPRGEFKFLGADAGLLQIGGGIAVDRALFEADLKQAVEAINGAIDRRVARRDSTMLSAIGHELAAICRQFAEPIPAIRLRDPPNVGKPQARPGSVQQSDEAQAEFFRSRFEPVIRLNQVLVNRDGIANGHLAGINGGDAVDRTLHLILEVSQAKLGDGQDSGLKRPPFLLA